MSVTVHTNEERIALHAYSLVKRYDKGQDISRRVEMLRRELRIFFDYGRRKEVGHTTPSVIDCLPTRELPSCYADWVYKK